ncbi:glucose 1-dehydrogenase [Paenibacillus sp. HB172176]|uniref:SDR family NAD(P)-dependent oxidoreductase n=1 Tax=Paenibacillus sp. HB172176 TaxID=2493690 RepID=UPI001439CBD7|nr:glucose 1-dehydrogenase [Paenibacillus sp. HB172176]
MRFKDKVCVITGGGSGIGEIAAKKFAEEGAAVVIVDRNLEQGDRVAGEIRGLYGARSAQAVRTDVSSEREVRSLADDIRKDYPSVDVLYNNAAMILPKLLEQVEEDEWSKVIDVNLKSVYLMTKHFIPMLRESKGNIVNMSSLNGLVGQKQNAVYAATKGGIIAMTKALALDYADDGVRVNCICPAGVMTPLLETWIEKQPNPAATHQLLNDMHALGRPAYGEEIADAVLFLASEQAKFITGLAMPVDGGASLGY